MQKTSLAKMSWKEVKAAQERKPVVLLPVGNIEMHGFHCPVGWEYIFGEKVSEKVAEKTGSLALPAVPYGWSEPLRGYPGSFSIREEALVGIYEDVCSKMLEDGFNHIVLVTPHQGNMKVVIKVARSIKKEHGIFVTWINPAAFAYGFAEELYGTSPSEEGHGGFISTAILSYLLPGMIDMKLAKVGQMAAEFRGFKVNGVSELSFKSKPVGICLDADEVSEGTWGDFSQATPEKGRVLFEKVVEHVCAFVEAFKDFDVRVHP